LEEVEEVNFVEYTDKHSYFLFQIILNEDICRDEILLGLKDRGIGVSIHYATPVPLMSYYKIKYGYQIEDFPNAVHYGDQSISLPVHAMLSEEDIEHVCNTIIRLLEK
jgi:dTDP-4-amino-4,6-dideoxygalactose transaminase